MPIVGGGGGGSGAVSSVFTRTGAVVAAANDYNYGQIANTANGIAISNLAAGLAGQVVQGVTPSYAYPPGYEWSYTQITANVSVTSTTEATGTTVITAGSFTPDGAAVLCTFFSPSINPASADLVLVSLFEGATQITRLGRVQDNTSVVSNVGCTFQYRFTPTNAAHTYTITAIRSAANGQVTAGVGGTGAEPPAFVRFTKV